jgi:protein-disulfide isomerase
MSNKQSKGKQGTTTRREAVREKRRAQQRKQRIYIVLGVIGAAIIIAAIVIIPSLTPVGDIVTITPQERPLVEGKAMGDPDAPVLIEVYEDFQCPACKSYSEQIEPQVIDTFIPTGEVYYVYRHFPFIDDSAPRNESDQAANASMCALDQDRFWDYHDMLFANWNNENQGAFNDKRLVAFAETLGLDMTAFNQCFDANSHQQEIASEYQMGRDNGVTGTPSVLVNGRIITPGLVPTFDAISQAVQAELAASSN